MGIAMNPLPRIYNAFSELGGLGKTVLSKGKGLDLNNAEHAAKLNTLKDFYKNSGYGGVTAKLEDLEKTAQNGHMKTNGDLDMMLNYARPDGTMDLEGINRFRSRTEANLGIAAGTVGVAGLGAYSLLSDD